MLHCPRGQGVRSSSRRAFITDPSNLFNDNDYRKPLSQRADSSWEAGPSPTRWLPCRSCTTHSKKLTSRSHISIYCKDAQTDCLVRRHRPDLKSPFKPERIRIRAYGTPSVQQNPSARSETILRSKIHSISFLPTNPLPPYHILDDDGPSLV